MGLRKAKVKKVELPSFVANLSYDSEEVQMCQESPVSAARSDEYLGSIFFGVCKEYFPPVHSLKLTSAKLNGTIVPSKESLLTGVFQKNVVPEEKVTVTEAFVSKPRRRKKLYDDPCIHRCPGIRKVFKQEIRQRVVDFGETMSKITGEISREIPYCRIRRTPSGTSKQEVEVVTLSDIRERNREFMSPEERMAHAHFPKEFATVQLIGPKIPASVVITSMPSRRKKLAESKYRVSKKKRDSDAKEDGEEDEREDQRRKVSGTPKKSRDEHQGSIQLTDQVLSPKKSNEVSSESLKEINEPADEERGSLSLTDLSGREQGSDWEPLASDEAGPRPERDDLEEEDEEWDLAERDGSIESDVRLE